MQGAAGQGGIAAQGHGKVAAKVDRNALVTGNAHGTLATIASGTDVEPSPDEEPDSGPESDTEDSE